MSRVCFSKTVGDVSGNQGSHARTCEQVGIEPVMVMTVMISVHIMMMFIMVPVIFFTIVRIGHDFFDAF
jgi:hypothetical protein